MKPFWQRVNERAAVVSNRNKIDSEKKRRYKKRLKNRDKLYKKRKSLGRI